MAACTPIKGETREFIVHIGSRYGAGLASRQCDACLKEGWTDLTTSVPESLQILAPVVALVRKALAQLPAVFLQGQKWSTGELPTFPSVEEDPGGDDFRLRIHGDYRFRSPLSASIGAAVDSLVEALPSPVNDNLTVPGFALSLLV